MSKIIYEREWRMITPGAAGSSRGKLLASLLSMAFFCAPAQMHSAYPVAANSEISGTVTLTLPKALELAALRNRRLHLAELAAAGAEQKRIVARSDYAPHIRNESSALYLTALEGIVLPAGALAHSSVTGLIPGETLRVGQGAQGTFTSGTGLVQPITQLLTVRAAVRAASADVHIARLQAEDDTNSVFLAVHKLYFSILVAQTQRKAVELAVNAATVDLDESTRAVSEGMALEVKKLQSRATLLGAKQAHLNLELELDDLTEQLNDLLGLPFGTILVLDSEALGRAPILPSREDAQQVATEKNPKILEAQQAVEKARAAVAAAKDAYIPNVTGVARYSYQSGVPFLVHNFGTFGGMVSYDLFDGGAREAKLKAARIQLSATELQLAQEEADVSMRVKALYNELHKLSELSDVAAETLAVRREAARVSTIRRQESAALDVDIARAEADVAVAQTGLLQSQLDLRLAEHEIQQFLGLRPE